MIIKLKDYKIENGAYGLVVLDSERNKAIKIFKKHLQENQAKNVFESEVQAYEKVQEIKDLKELTPIFYGKKKIDKIFDKNDKNISSEYELDCVYEMEYIHEKFIKIGYLEDRKNAEEIKKIFRDNGILHIIDASCALDTKNKIKKVIDFACKEFEVFV